MALPSETTVAFIGTGVMGLPMAEHLLDAGYPLVAFNRTPSRARPLVDRGATLADSPGDAAAAAHFVVTMVGYPTDVENVYLGQGGIVERAREGAVLVDMTTSSPTLAARIAKAAAARGVHALDAPVSGGDIGARNATLSIMAGGDADAFARVEPLLKVMGTNISLQGAAGAGQHTKMANQIAIAGSMLGTVESLIYAERAGLDPQSVLIAISSGAASSWSLNNLAPRILAGDFAPGFYVKHFVKDMSIALTMASDMKLDLPGLACAKRLYQHLELNGGANLGTQALWLLYASDAARIRFGINPRKRTLTAPKE